MHKSFFFNLHTLFYTLSLSAYLLRALFTLCVFSSFPRLVLPIRALFSFCALRFSVVRSAFSFRTLFCLSALCFPFAHSASPLCIPLFLSAPAFLLSKRFVLIFSTRFVAVLLPPHALLPRRISASFFFRSRKNCTFLTGDTLHTPDMIKFFLADCEIYKNCI